tara:strand:+ start:35 stop:376 length:342 start_codon:yes stop_codon:yes gene_type:complete
MSNKKDTVKVVNLKMWKDGNWGYTLPTKNVITTEKECKSGVRMATVSPRYQTDENGQVVMNAEVMKEQSSYNFHYIALDDYYNASEKSELIEDGWTNKAYLDVMTGEYELIQE